MTFDDASDIADAAIEEFTSGNASNVYLVYNEFKSVMTQRIVVERLLPIPRLEADAAGSGTECRLFYEPAPADIFRDLLAPPRPVQSIGRCSNERRPSSRAR